jgi:PHD/YefM family antitoxin component YafN of YafNO toxin-antitoxin module
LVLTVNGKAQLVVQDAESYQNILEALDRAEAVEGIRRGLEDVKNGRTKPAKQFLTEMRKKYKLPKRGEG